jgi:hypothetical protein
LDRAAATLPRPAPAVRTPPPNNPVPIDAGPPNPAVSAVLACKRSHPRPPRPAATRWLQAIAERLYQHRRYAYCVNFAHALPTITDSMVRLLLGVEASAVRTTLVLAMAANVEALRPDRAYPRKMKPAKLQGFFPNYKRCR